MNKSSLKTIIPTTIGTALEWAEYTFFAFMADLLSQHFFPIENPELARLKTYAIFATSYFMRPLGAILFGYIGDKFGRKPALINSMLLMCMATTAIGFLPTYSSIGANAAILLLFCRILQGVAIAGEFNGSAIFMLEHYQHRPYLAGSLTPFSAAFGMALGALAATLVSLPAAPVYAWRIPFICSGFIGLVAYYLRKNVAETPIYQQSRVQKKSVNPVEIFDSNTRALWLTTFFAIFTSVFVYIGSVYYKILCVKVGNLSPHLASEIVTGGQFLAALMILGLGFIADRVGGIKICLLGLGSTILAGPFIMSCAQSGEVYLTILGQVLYALCNGLVSAPMMNLMIRQFSPEVRYRGNSIAWSIPVAIFGGTTLIVAENLVNYFGYMGPGLYISAAAFLTFFAVFLSVGTPAMLKNKHLFQS